MPTVTVRVLAAVDLRNRDTGLFGDVSDPYVSLTFGGVEKRTATVQNNLNPRWTYDNEFTWKFQSFDEEGTQKMLVEVVNDGRIKNSLGKLSINLKDLTAGEWNKFLEKLENKWNMGELQFEVKVVTRQTNANRRLTPPTLSLKGSTATLVMRVLGAYNLKNRDSGIFGDVSDPFVAVKIGELEKRTPTIRNNLNPKWNVENEFVFRFEGVEEAVLEMEVVNDGKIKNTLGTATVHMKMLSAGVRHKFREKLVNAWDEGEIEFELKLYPASSAMSLASMSEFSLKTPTAQSIVSSTCFFDASEHPLEMPNMSETSFD